MKIVLIKIHFKKYIHNKTIKNSNVLSIFEFSDYETRQALSCFSLSFINMEFIMELIVFLKKLSV